MLTPSLRSSLLHRPSMLAKRRAMPITSRYRTLISPPSCADECPASGHRVSASPTALPGATAVSGNRSTSYGNVSSRSTKSWCTALRGSAAGTRDSRPRKRARKWSVYICIPALFIYLGVNVGRLRLKQLAHGEASHGAGCGARRRAPERRQPRSEGPPAGSQRPKVAVIGVLKQAAAPLEHASLHGDRGGTNEAIRLDVPVHRIEREMLAEVCGTVSVSVMTSDSGHMRLCGALKRITT